MPDGIQEMAGEVPAVGVVMDGVPALNRQMLD